MRFAVPSRRVFVHLVPVVAVALAYAAAATAAGAATIHACVKPKSGATRIVGAKAKCRHGEEKLSWNTSGPTGSKGPAGAPGAAGTTGGEGRPGTSGEGPVYSVSGGMTPITLGSDTIVLSKVLPPGAYDVSAKLDVGSEAGKHGFFEVICGLVDSPGTTPSSEGTTVDVTFDEQALIEESAGEWFAVTGITTQGTFTSKVTTTLSLGCGNLNSGEPVAKAVDPQLQALAVTAVL